MVCLKCGREIEENQVFCPDCVDDMEKYPVKPGTAIQLPRRTETSLQKKSHARRRTPPTQEEQIRSLRKALRVFIIIWLVTLALLAATIYPTVEYLLAKDVLLPGQNYSTFTDSTEP